MGSLNYAAVARGSRPKYTAALIGACMGDGQLPEYPGSILVKQATGRPEVRDLRAGKRKIRIDKGGFSFPQKLTEQLATGNGLCRSRPPCRGRPRPPGTDHRCPTAAHLLETSSGRWRATAVDRSVLGQPDHAMTGTQAPLSTTEALNSRAVDKPDTTSTLRFGASVDGCVRNLVQREHDVGKKGHAPDAQKTRCARTTSSSRRPASPGLAAMRSSPMRRHPLRRVHPWPYQKTCATLARGGSLNVRVKTVAAER